MLLARRAAAILPALSTDSPQQRDAAFLIPVFKLSAEEQDKDEQVAAILVHVAHDFVPDEVVDEELFSGLSRALVSREKLYSSGVLGSVNDVSSSLPANKRRPEGLLWVCIDFGGDAVKRPRRFLYSREDNAMGSSLLQYSLWLRGINAWRGDGEDGKKTVEFISSAVARELRLLLLSSSQGVDVMQVVYDDFQEEEKEQQRDVAGLVFEGNRDFFIKKKRSLRFFRDTAREMATCALPASLRSADNSAESVEADDQEEVKESEPRNIGEVCPTSPPFFSGKGSEPTQQKNGALSGRKREEDEKEAEAFLLPPAWSDFAKQDSRKKKMKKTKKVSTVRVISFCTPERE